ncbi:MAG: hypothetical protein ACR2GP_03270 [Burkholderiaceae bacterium]
MLEKPMELEIVDAPTPSKIPLKSIDDVRVEMGKVYRAMKGGSLLTQEGTRLVYVLSAIGKLIELHEIEMRVRTLEEAQGPGRIGR